MMFATTIMALVGLAAVPMTLAGVASNAVLESLSTRADADLPYPVGIMTLTGTVGGYEVQLNGSIQEIYAQVKQAHPDFDAEALVSKVAAREDGARLDARGKIQPGLCCPIAGQPWRFCNAGRIQEGVDYLNHVSALCWTPGKTCVRVSCSYNAAIYLCNDRPDTISPTCPYIGSYASDLIKQCAFYDQIGNGYVCGQEFDTDGYNVIVREDSC